MKESAFLVTVIQNLSTKIREIKEREFVQTEYHDLSAASIHYISVISSMSHPTLVQLATKLGLSKPTVTIMVNKLLEKGCVRKLRSPEDGRVFYITLTESGERIAAAYQEAHYKVAEHIASRLSGKEIKTLITLLTKIS